MKKNYMFVIIVTILVSVFAILLSLNGKKLRLQASIADVNELIIKDDIAIFERNTTLNDIILMTEINNVKIYDKDREIEPTEKIKTNERLVIGNNEYTISVLGDVIADGLVNYRDIGRAYRCVSTPDFSSLTDAEKYALDINNDGYKNGGDLLIIYSKIGKPDTNTISLNKTMLELDINESEILIATIEDISLEDKTVTWTSSNESIAIVDQNGLVIGISTGSTTIVATASNGKIAKCRVNIVAEPTGIILSKSSLKVDKDNHRTISATIVPEYVEDKTVTWTSSDPSVATVNQNGRIDGLKVGNATITATTSNGISATCEVTIRDTYEINDLSTSSSESAARANTEILNNHLKIVANSDYYQKVKLKEGTYYFYIDIDTAISISSYKENGVTYRMDNIYLDLNDSKIKMYGTLDNPISDYRYYIFKVNNVKNVSISNGTITGDRKSHDYSVTHPDADTLNTHEWGIGINVKDSTNVTLKDLDIHDTTGDGIRIQDGMSYDTNSCSEVNNTSKIYIKNNNIHGIRRNGITIIAGSNIEITGNEIYNIGGSYTHLDGTSKTGTNPKAGIDLERNKSETCAYTDPSTGKSKTQIEEFIKNVSISNNKIYNNVGKDITFLNGMYDFTVTNNELEKPIHTSNSYEYCDAPSGGVYEGVNRCYVGDNISFYSANKIKDNFRFTISDNTGAEGINTLDISRSAELASQFGTTSDRVCCKSFRGNNNCQKPENNPVPMTCNNQ